MRVVGGLVFASSLLATTLFAAPLAHAERVTATGTRVENDTFGTANIWGRSLDLPEAGKIVRVMGGTYGFQLVNKDGDVVGDFLFPDDAVGFELPAGSYALRPLICRIHRHHHVEVTVEY